MCCPSRREVLRHRVRRRELRKLPWQDAYEAALELDRADVHKKSQNIPKKRPALYLSLMRFISQETAMTDAEKEQRIKELIAERGEVIERVRGTWSEMTADGREGLPVPDTGSHRTELD